MYRATFIITNMNDNILKSINDAVAGSLSIRVGTIVRELMSGVPDDMLREIVKNILKDYGFKIQEHPPTPASAIPAPIPTVPEVKTEKIDLDSL